MFYFRIGKIDKKKSVDLIIFLVVMNERISTIRVIDEILLLSALVQRNEEQVPHGDNCLGLILFSKSQGSIYYSPLNLSKWEAEYGLCGCFYSDNVR